ncbi:ABC1 family protein [Cryptosporidium felis]|nr:ABC1 family protein [Cryptosporidium felis]
MSELDSWNRKWTTLWRWTRIYVHFKKSQVRARNPLEEARYAYWSEEHSQFAEFAWKNILELHRWWARVGHFLSTRTELLPKECVPYLEGLQDMIPSFEWGLMEEIVAEELGPDWRGKFEETSEAPIASTSIAQAHKGVLKSGEKVLLKIQSPNIREVLSQDINCLAQLSWAFGFLEKATDFELPFLEEWQKLVNSELDLCSERRNLAKAYEMFRDSGIQIKIPKIFPELSGKKVLTMEFLDGFRITDKEMLREKGIKYRRELLEILCDSFAYQIHIHGFFHVDPHPGNVFVVYDQETAKYVPAILDWGPVVEFEKKTQIAFSKMVYCLYNLNLVGFMEALEELGFCFRGRDEGSISDPEICMDALRLVFRDTEVDATEWNAIRVSFLASEDPKDAGEGPFYPLASFTPLPSPWEPLAQELLFKESFHKGATRCLKPPRTKESAREGFRNKFEKRLWEYAKRVATESGVLGLQITVVKEGRLLGQVSLGRKRELSGDLVDESTLFSGFFLNIGLLVAGILLCVERKLIALDDPVCHYWDGFIRYGKRNVTLRHILEHRSGIGSFFPEDLHFLTLLDYRKMTDLIQDSHLEGPAGVKTRYCPFLMSWVLSELISLVSEQPAPAFIFENLIAPLGLQDGMKVYCSSLGAEEGMCSFEKGGPNRSAPPSPFSLSSPSFASSPFFSQQTLGESFAGLSSLGSKIRQSAIDAAPMIGDLGGIIMRKLAPEKEKRAAEAPREEGGETEEKEAGTREDCGEAPVSRGSPRPEVRVPVPVLPAPEAPVCAPGPLAEAVRL